MLKYSGIKPVLTTIKNPQANNPVDQVHQVILNMLFTKDIDNKVFDYIYPWGESLVNIAWAIRASYHCTIEATPGQVVFDISIIFNLASVVYWRVIISNFSIKWTLIMYEKTLDESHITTQLAI